MSQSVAISAKNLKMKSTPELYDILRRQEAIISKVKFLHSLPDKGRKVINFARTVKNEIEEREGLSSTADMLQEMKLSDDKVSGESRHTKERLMQFSSLQDSLTVHEMSEDCTMKDEESDIGHLVNTSVKEKIYNFEMSPRRSEPLRCETSSQLSKSPFRPNRTLKISNISELPEEYKVKSKISSDNVNRKVCDDNTHRNSDSELSLSTVKNGTKFSDVSPLFHEVDYKFGQAKTLSLQESFLLQQQQKEHLKRLQGEHAAKRLAEKKTQQQSLAEEVHDTRYRERVQLDSDDEDVDVNEDDATRDEMNDEPSDID